MNRKYRVENINKRLAVLLCAVIFICTFAESFFMADVTAYAADKGIYLSETKKSVVVSKSVSLKLVGAKASKVEWTSTNPKVAKVKNGKVTGLKKGTATIKAKYKGKTYKCVVSVENPRLSQTKLTMTVGAGNKITVRGTKGVVRWSSSNSSVASVANGVITAHKIGNAKIYAKVGGKTFQCSVKVTTLQEVYAEQLVKLINYERSKYGVAPLTTNKKLKKAATVRAQELAKYYSDTRPNKTSCFSAIPSSYKWKKASELTARKFLTPQDVVSAWAKESDRLAVVINKNYKEIGVSVYLAPDGYLYWCVFEAYR